MKKKRFIWINIDKHGKYIDTLDTGTGKTNKTGKNKWDHFKRNITETGVDK